MPARIFAALTVMMALSPAAAPLSAAPLPDAADPLKMVAVYNGAWRSDDEAFDTQFSKASKETVNIANTCATEGEFYVCDQQVSKPSGPLSALVVFHWNARDRVVETYVIQSTGGDAYNGHLMMAGDTWTWQAASPATKAATLWRTLNIFSGPDHIVYKTQYSADGGSHWTTTRQGRETRVTK